MEASDCSFRNNLNRMIILRCFGAENYYLARVIFPFEILNFSAPEEAEVEIWSHEFGGAELVESFKVAELHT